MCFQYDAEPPAPEGAPAPVQGERIRITGQDGTELDAFQANATERTGAGVVILPDVRGLFAFYERLAERFAGLGIDAIAFDYFARTAPPVAERTEEFEFGEHVPQTRPEQITSDLEAAIDQLTNTTEATKIFTIGFCFGGSYSFMNAANELGQAGAIGFYGGLRARSEGAETPIQIAPRTKAPVLGLFGGADQGIPQELIDEFERALQESGAEHQIHVYPGAPHSFFDRKSADFQAESQDAWQRVLAFIQDHQ
jgi:carboxymethylenebutenolidase